MTSRKASFDDFVFDLGTGELTRRGIAIPLESKPKKVLHVLLERPGQIVTREQLKLYVWGEVGRDLDDAIHVAISKLRAALGGNRERIKSVRGEGYRFESVVSLEDTGTGHPSNLTSREKDEDLPEIDLEIAFEPSFDPDDVRDLMTALADYYRKCGGAGLKIEFDQRRVGTRELVDA